VAKSSKDVGIRVDDYRLDVRAGVQRAREQAFTAVEFGADHGEITPETLSESGRRHVARIVASEGLKFAALAHEGGGMLADPAQVDRAVHRTGQILRLAKEVGAPIVSHEVGDLLDLSDTERPQVLDALRELGEQAARYGTIYAVRSRLCKPDELANLIRTLNSPLVKIGVDPAGLLMAGYDPVEAVARFGDNIVLAYVRDATRGTPQAAGEETPLGRGRLDLASYLATLNAGGYHGAPILRRARALEPSTEIAADRSILLQNLPG
jgi:sugar phosphate isomerase/epimerase